MIHHSVPKKKRLVKLTKEMMTNILDAVKKGVSLGEACQANGLKPEDLAIWRSPQTLKKYRMMKFPFFLDSRLISIGN